MARSTGTSTRGEVHDEGSETRNSNIRHGAMCLTSNGGRDRRMCVCYSRVSVCYVLLVGVCVCYNINTTKFTSKVAGVSCVSISTAGKDHEELSRSSEISGAQARTNKYEQKRPFAAKRRKSHTWSERSRSKALEKQLCKRGQQIVK